MKITLHKSGKDRHRFMIERADGTREECELETRSFLLHDLAHFAFETEARITYGFWGRLARGATITSLYAAAAPGAGDPELMLVEQLVAPLQSLWHGRMSQEQYLAHIQSIPVTFVDAAFVAAVLARMRRLWGEWTATRHGETMLMTWEY